MKFQMESWINQWKELTGLPVLLVLPVQSVHSLQQLPLLAAAGVVDEVPGEDLFELADREVFYCLLVVQIRQRRSDPPLGRRTDLKSIKNTHSYTLSLLVFSSLLVFCIRDNHVQDQHGLFFTSKIFSVCSRFSRDAVEMSSCSCFEKK